MLIQTSYSNNKNFRGTNVGPCLVQGCSCNRYDPPTQAGGYCNNCSHNSATHAVLCAECSEPIIDMNNALQLFCLEYLCPTCSKKHGFLFI